MPSLMGDALGKCAAIGAKLGGEVGRDIEKEHPEYMKPPEGASESKTKDKDSDESSEKQ